MRPLVGYEWSAGRCKQVAFVGRDGHVHEFHVGIGGRWQHTDLTTIADAPLAQSRFIVGYDWPEVGLKQIAYLGWDSHVHELWLRPGAEWHHADLTTRAGAPPARIVTTGYSWAPGHSKQVVFVGDDDHIHELSVDAGGHWQHVDLTAITAAPLCGSNFMVGFGWSEGNCKQIAYVGKDSHVHELVMEIGKSWVHTDLTSITNAPHAVDLTVGFEWKEGHCKELAFVGEDRHVHELYLPAGEQWVHVDLTSITHAPDAMNIVTGYAWPEGHSKQIAFLGLDRHIHELYVQVGDTWKHADLTNLSHAPVTSVLTLDGYGWSAGNTKQLVYMGEDRQVRELWMSPTTDWMYTDLSREVIILPVGM